VVVHDTNYVVKVSVSYLDKYEPKGKVVGVAADKYCFVLTKNGKYVLFPTNQKRKVFQAFKTLDADDEIKFAVGLADTDELCLQKEDGEIVWTSVDLLSVSRPNIKGKKLFPAKAVVRVPRRSGIVSVDGSELEQAEYADDFLVVCDKNLVCFSDGKRVVKGYDEVVELLSKQQALVVPLIEGAKDGKEED
jgi:hypothetical protein